MPRTTTDAAARPRPGRAARFARSWTGLMGLAVLLTFIIACVGSLPWTLGSAGRDATGLPLPARYKQGDLSASLLPPSWAPHAPDEAARRDARAAALARERLGREPTADEIRATRPVHLLGTDKLGRDVLTRCLAGGGVSIGIGLAAAIISVFIGTVYGSIAGYLGGRIDGAMMRVVDVLYGLPYLLLMVLLAVAGDALLVRFTTQEPARRAYVEAALASAPTPHDAALLQSLRDEARTRYPGRPISEGQRAAYEVLVLLVAIGGLSWLTMSRVIRGQVLSLRAQPFIEAARAIGVPLHQQFLRHLLPNLMGPILVYATLTVPQAILQESFLSFLGIGVRPPLPSWGNLAAEGLTELNPVRVRWWLIVSPCALLGATLLALNFMGEGLREALDPRRSHR
ncbi:MAG: ABC transporter permease [Planctomycetota bacterium]|nr:ABC transporter permease [Planctomycetota bacterium]